MNKITLTIILTIVSIAFSFSQSSESKEVEITGKVIDQQSGQALEYATIAFFSKQQNKIITGGITDVNGNFSIPVPTGIYDVTIEFISFKTQSLPNKQITTDENLGTISLAEDVESLEAVEVIAEKTTVDIRLDKKIYNIGKDLTVRGGTVSDVLDNVPSVSVDVEGNVQLRGNDDVRILINGKPSGLVGLNSTDALRQLPAESIERVEVITSPSARYDAEGSGGILNIILRRSKLQGLNGALTINTGFPWQAGVNGNLNYRTGDINIFTNTGYNYRERPGNSFSEQQFFVEDQSGNVVNGDFLREDTEFDRIRKGFNSNFGIEWYVNESTSITNSIFYRSSDNDNTSLNQTFQRDIDGTIEEGLRLDPEIENDRTFQYALNIDKQFNDTGHKLTFDFQFEDSDEVESSLILQDGIETESVRTAEAQRRILIQTDYVLPIGEDSQFELGYRGDFNKLDSDYDVIFINPTLEELAAGGITDPSNVLDFKETINAFYTQYGNKINKFSFLAGLRYETTRLFINQVETNNLQRNNFDAWFPTLNLNYEFSDTESIQLGYNRRLSRPRSFFLNPFPSRSSPTNLFQGNPALTPAFSNQIDLGYLKRFEKLTFNASVYFQRTTDVITFVTIPTDQITILDGQEVPVTLRTPLNIASNERIGGELTLTYRPSRKWNMNGNFNIFNLVTEGETELQSLDAENLSWFIRFNNKLTLPGKVDWQTRLFYRGPTETAQARNQGIFTMSLAFSKDFFNEKASIALNVDDVFNSRKRMSDIFIPNTFEQYSEFQWRERTINLSFTYRFNQKKQRERQRGGFEGGDGEFEGQP